MNSPLPAGTAQPRFTGVRLLADNDEAWLAKRHLIGQAGRTLDLSYFILEVDGSTSRLLLDLIAAAGRGVRVRLLVDYFLTFAQAPVLRMLAAVPNIAVRRYGPPSPGWLAALDAAGIDRDGFIKGLMSTNGAMMAAALKGNTIFPARVADTLGALRAEPGQSGAGFSMQVLAAVAPAAEAGLAGAADGDAASGSAALAALGQAAGIAVPDRTAALRQVATVIQIVRGLKQFLHRSHHKLLLADGRRFIMGGRNLADAYQCTVPPPNVRAFQDTDILAHDGSPGGSGHQQAFEHLWTHPHTADIAQADPLDERPAQPLAELQRVAVPAPDLERGASFRRGLELPDVDGTLVDNFPADKGDATITRAYTERIQQFVASGQPGAIDIVSAYVFLVDDDRDSPALLGMRNAFLAAAKAGIKVSIYTNSLDSTDLKPVNRAAYPKLIELIGAGVNVFELDKDQGSLHTKCAAIGDTCLIVGSYNMDPRSELYDTNNLLVLEDASGEATAAFRSARISALKWSRLTVDEAQRLAGESKPASTARLTSGLL
uniref:Phosphatidylserine/phosphatidylglycerophosphate/ cardiolipin synthase n=1 Tax=uncultured bacterium EC5 TaxID=672206 RepID=G4WV80_9BACT|nr:phosphatidylserine/phosphatidylglycerophosphate/cardiolipin synthase [uncultured bacterium EC5]